MNAFCLISTTFPNEQSAREIMMFLLENKLVACVQMMPIQSFYHWEGKLCESSEQLVLMKTQSSLFAKIEEAIVQHHPYTIPQLIQIPIERGLETYLQWIKEATT